MTVTEKSKYSKAEDLKNIIRELAGKKFQLDCGHHVTFGHNLGNDIAIFNGKNIKIICTLCSY
jgi:hypothetical protein